jgi:hypothetical protein
MALRAAQLELIPLIGSGHMLWLAQQHGKHEDAYCKPNAAHALAAIGVALGGKAEEALEAGRLLLEEGRVVDPLTVLRDCPTVISVFEDSSTGVNALLSAVETLFQAGLDVDARIIGIAVHGEKRRALEALGAVVYTGIDEALAAQWD